MTKKTTSEEWIDRFDKKFDYLKLNTAVKYFISTLILQKQKETLKKVDEIITDRMFAIANEPLNKRQNSYDELLDIRDKINKSLCKTQTQNNTS